MNIDAMKDFMNVLRAIIEDRVFWYETAWKRGDKIDMTIPITVEHVINYPLLVTVHVTVDVDTPPRVGDNPVTVEEDPSKKKTRSPARPLIEEADRGN